MSSNDNYQSGKVIINGREFGAVIDNGGITRGFASSIEYDDSDSGDCNKDDEDRTKMILRTVKIHMKIVMDLKTQEND